MKKILILYFISIFFLPSIFSDLITGLAAHYTLDGNFSDSSGNNKHGTAYGNIASVNDRFGNTNSAHYFDGSDDYVDIPTSIISGTNKLTYALWINVPVYSSTGWPVFIGSYYSSAGSNINFGIYQNTGKFYMEVHTSSGNYYGQGSAVTWNTWQHVAMVYDGSTIKNYINGVLASTLTGVAGNLLVPSGLYIGQYHPSYTKVHGTLDDIYIYNRDLSQVEIQQLMSNTVPEPDILILFMTGIFLKFLSFWNFFKIKKQTNNPCNQ